jgi:hypothetical protein
MALLLVTMFLPSRPGERSVVGEIVHNGLEPIVLLLLLLWCWPAVLAAFTLVSAIRGAPRRAMRVVGWVSAILGVGAAAVGIYAFGTQVRPETLRWLVLACAAGALAIVEFVRSIRGEPWATWAHILASAGSSLLAVTFIVAGVAPDSGEELGAAVEAWLVLGAAVAPSVLFIAFPWRLVRQWT